MNPWGVLMAAAGSVMLCAAAFNWNWLMNRRAARFGFLNRTAARIVYGVLGAALLALGIFLAVGLSALVAALGIVCILGLQTWLASGGRIEPLKAHLIRGPPDGG